MPSEGRPVVVLNVNDSPAARYLVSRILRSVGWTVHEAETGMQALALACEIHPDVAVLDIRLPDLSGYEVCERLKADPATNAISVIQTSASFTSSHGKARGLDSGADAYLSPRGCARCFVSERARRRRVSRRARSPTPTAARTSFSPCWRTSCATRWRSC
jgi:CheY-like chemotaxis protein